MKYHFSFERKRLFLLLAGMCLLGFLTFVGGMVTGIGLWMPTRSEIALLQQSRGITGATVSATAPAVPALTAPALTAATLTAPAIKAPALTAPTVTPPAPAAASIPRAAEAPQPAAPAAAAAAEPLPEAPLVHPPITKTRNLFCLQLGSFSNQDNAKKLQAELKDKGYAAIIFEQIDSDQRTWHAVRIGGYDSLDSASRAAADFSNKERIQALVRKSDSL